jgi:hypothetical protein
MPKNNDLPPEMPQQNVEYDALFLNEQAIPNDITAIPPRDEMYPPRMPKVNEEMGTIPPTEPKPPHPYRDNVIRFPLRPPHDLPPAA